MGNFSSNSSNSSNSGNRNNGNGNGNAIGNGNANVISNCNCNGNGNIHDSAIVREKNDISITNGMGITNSNAIEPLINSSISNCGETKVAMPILEADNISFKKRKFSRFRPISRIFFGLRNKMLWSFSVVIILSVVLMSYFTITKYSNALERNNIDYSNQVLGNLIRNLDDYISGIEEVTNLAVYNHYIQTFLFEQSRKVPIKESPAQTIGGLDNNQSFEMSLELLGNFIYTRKDIASILVFNNYGLSLFKSSNLNIDTTYDFTKDSWYARTVGAGKNPIITGPHDQSYLTENPQTVFSVSRLIEGYDGLGNVGTILVDTNLKVIEDLCTTAELIGNGYVFVIDSDNNMIFHPDNKNKISQPNGLVQNDVYTDIYPLLTNSPAGSFTSVINNEKEQLVFKRMTRTNWIIVAVTPYKDMIADANSINFTVMIAGILCLLLIITMINFLSTRFTKPVVALTKIMNQADNGNLDIRSNIDTNDEISTLSNSFNNMLERIDTLMKQVVVDQEEKRKSDLKVLQSQINPHFLYNTLDSIVWMIAGNNKNAIRMIEALSRFFRISLSRGEDLVTLFDEFEHVKNYLIIQGMRYQNKIEFTINADPSILQYKTLKFILQPLVENSIYHGIKNKEEKGFIHITANVVDDRLIIAVEDDGVGMDEETCQNILKESFVQKKPSGSGIGVRNVNSRIRLYFGSEYGLSFKSTLGVGTTVYLTLPIIKE